MRYHADKGQFKAITAKLGRRRILQASRFASAGIVTLICSCGARGIRSPIKSTMTTAANGNNAPMSEWMRYALNCVATCTLKG